MKGSLFRVSLHLAKKVVYRSSTTFLPYLADRALFLLAFAWTTLLYPRLPFDSLFPLRFPSLARTYLSTFTYSSYSDSCFAPAFLFFVSK